MEPDLNIIFKQCLKKLLKLQRKKLFDDSKMKYNNVCIQYLDELDDEKRSLFRLYATDASKTYRQTRKSILFIDQEF